MTADNEKAFSRHLLYKLLISHSIVANFATSFIILDNIKNQLFETISIIFKKSCSKKIYVKTVSFVHTIQNLVMQRKIRWNSTLSDICTKAKTSRLYYKAEVFQRKGNAFNYWKVKKKLNQKNTHCHIHYLIYQISLKANSNNRRFEKNRYWLYRRQSILQNSTTLKDVSRRCRRTLIWKSWVMRSSREFYPFFVPAFIVIPQARNCDMNDLWHLNVKYLQWKSGISDL